MIVNNLLMLMKITNFNLIVLINLIINSNNWIIIWIFMEMFNFLMSLTLINIMNNMIKFFLYQMILAMNILLLIIINNSWLLNYNKIILLMMIIFFLKMNMYPMNFWLMNIQKNINWSMFILINYIYKIPNIFIIKNFFIINNLLYLLMFMSLILFNMNNYKLMFFNLSINNFYWIIMLNNFNFNYLMLFLITYLIMNIISINIINFLKINYFNNNLILNNNKLKFMISMFNLISIPFLFMYNLKWMMIKMLKTNLFFIFFIFINFINQLIYLKILIKLFLMNFNYTKWFINNYNMNLNMNLMLIYFLINLFI